MKKKRLRNKVRELEQIIFGLKDELLKHTNPNAYKAKKEIEKCYMKEIESDILSRCDLNND